MSPVGGAGRVHETWLRVRYAETDQMGVVYHANYLVWMEVGRVEYCRAAGVCYRDMEADGYLLAVVESQVRYLRPARYDDEIVVRTRVLKSGPRLVKFGYEILRQEELLATGSTTHVFCTRDFRPVKLPPAYACVFREQEGTRAVSVGHSPASKG